MFWYFEENAIVILTINVRISRYKKQAYSNMALNLKSPRVICFTINLNDSQKLTTGVYSNFLYSTNHDLSTREVVVADDSGSAKG